MVNNLGFEKIPLYTSLTATVIFSDNTRACSSPSRLDYLQKWLFVMILNAAIYWDFLPSHPSLTWQVKEGRSCKIVKCWAIYGFKLVYCLHDSSRSFSWCHVLFPLQLKASRVSQGDECKARSAESWVLVTTFFPAVVLAGSFQCLPRWPFILGLACKGLQWPGRVKFCNQNKISVA